MEKNRLISISTKLCEIYILAMSLVFFFWQTLFWSYYTSEENERDYCIDVDPSEPHSFLISENNACRIDWFYFVQEPLTGTALVYLVVIGPVALIGFILKAYLKKNASASV